MSYEIVEERIYNIPFYPKLNSTPRSKRAPRAMRLLREFIIRHMKSEDLIIYEEVNELIWSRGIKKPPRKISVRAIKMDDDVIIVRLADAVLDDSFVSKETSGIRAPKEEEIEDEEEFDQEEENWNAGFGV